MLFFSAMCAWCVCVCGWQTMAERNMKQPLQLTTYNSQLTTYNLQLLMPQKKRGKTTNECPPNASQLEPLLSKPNISLSSFDYQNNLIYVAQLCVRVCVCVSVFGSVSEFLLSGNSNDANVALLLVLFGKKGWRH